jgi:hypothetical protein
MCPHDEDALGAFEQNLMKRKLDVNSVEAAVAAMRAVGKVPPGSQFGTLPNVGSIKLKLSTLARVEDEWECARKHADNTKGRPGGKKYEMRATEMENTWRRWQQRAPRPTSLKKRRGDSTSLSTRQLGS